MSSHCIFNKGFNAKDAGDAKEVFASFGCVVVVDFVIWFCVLGILGG
jgi:hypothetical protein